MAARFEARSDNDIDAGLFKSEGFGWCRGCSDSNDALGAAFVENLLRRDPDDEAEDGHLCVEQDARLVFKLDWSIRLVRRRRATQAAICLATWARLRWNSSLPEVRAPSSSIETQRFIGKGLVVSS